MDICDTHQDIYDATVGTRKGAGQTSFEQVVRTLKIIQAAVFVPPWEDKDKEEHKDYLRYSIIHQLAWYQTIIKNNPQLYLILNREDLELVLKSDKTGVILHLEGADGLDVRSIQDLHKFHGLRSVGMVWMRQGKYASPSNLKDGGGLSEAGAELVDQLIKLNMAIDAAHLNEKSFDDLIAIARREKYPVIFSHGNVRALCDHHRNLTNRQLRELQSVDGLLGLSAVGSFIRPSSANVNDWLLHYEYAKSILGEDRLMIGSDFGGVISHPVQELSSTYHLRRLCYLLVDRYGEWPTKKLMGQNFINFYRRLWR